MARPSKATLGSCLEWHGTSIRVVVTVPPKVRPLLGVNKLKQGLGTSKPSEAEVLKWPVLAQLKRRIQDAARGVTVKHDAITELGLGLRDELKLAQRGKHPNGLSGDELLELIETAAERLHQTRGEEAATKLFSLATKQATPITLFRDDWLLSCKNGRTREARMLAISRLCKWCVVNSIPDTIEAITSEVAGDYVTECFERKAVRKATANKDIGAISSYWAYLGGKGKKGFTSNPWLGKKLKEEPAGFGGDDPTDKRPFTEAEARTLIEGITDKTVADMQAIAALSGMRISEIVALKVKHIEDDVFAVPGTKTKNAKRMTPIHPALSEIIARRCKGKEPNDFLIEELPIQTSDRRSRAAPISQAFTRYRRDLDVDERPDGVRQSRIDFHSWRRWFIRKAADALSSGATGFTPWTIAEVVGHSKDDAPLGMTMGTYHGKASSEQLRACVSAVALPCPLRVELKDKRTARQSRQTQPLMAKGAKTRVMKRKLLPRK